MSVKTYILAVDDDRFIFTMKPLAEGGFIVEAFGVTPFKAANFNDAYDVLYDVLAKRAREDDHGSY